MDEMEKKTSPTSNAKLKTMELNNTKAGMEGLDVDTINTIINEASKNSKYYEHKLKQQKDVEKRIEEMKVKLAGFSKEMLHESELQMKKFGEQLENSRDYSRFIVHMDMDAFYASVEMRDDPSLTSKPMAVGSKSMLCTSNYVARRFGVRAGMPGFIGKKLCPQLIIIPPNFEKYTAVSAQIQKILKDFDPDFLCPSLDEAYLDITTLVESSEKSPEELLQELRSKIFEATQLTCSAGLASNGFLAKLCGDICKPNGQHYLPKTREAESKFVNALPIRKVNGIGGITELLLKGLEIHSCEDIWKKRAELNLLFKPITSQRLIQISKGYQVPWDTHYTEGDRKSISCDITLDKGTSDVPHMLGVLEKIAEDLSSQLLSRHMRCKSVVLKIKTVDFVVNSRSVNLVNFTNKSVDIFEAAKGILQGYVKERGKLSVRLLGIRVSKWDEKRKESTTSDSSTSSHSFHDEPPSKQLRIEEAFEKVYKSSKNIPSNQNNNNFDCPACQQSFSSERAVEIHLDDCPGLHISPQVSQTPNSQPSTKVDEEDNTNETSDINNDNNSSDSNPHPSVHSHFTCPICFKEIQSLVENIEIASSDHVNFCIENPESVEQSHDGNSTWKICNATYN